MAGISKKDVQSFAKVLRAIADAVESDPSLILGLAETKQQKPTKESKKTESLEYSERVNSVDLYAKAKELSEDKLIEFLSEYTVDELKGMLKKYSLGYTRLKTVESISKYIADQLKKRTTDVFLQHEK